MRTVLTAVVLVATVVGVSVFVRGVLVIYRTVSAGRPAPGRTTPAGTRLARVLGEVPVEIEAVPNALGEPFQADEDGIRRGNSRQHGDEPRHQRREGLFLGGAVRHPPEHPHGRLRLDESGCSETLAESLRRGTFRAAPTGWRRDSLPSAPLPVRPAALVGSGHLRRGATFPASRSPSSSRRRRPSSPSS